MNSVYHQILRKPLNKVMIFFLRGGRGFKPPTPPPNPRWIHCHQSTSGPRIAISLLVANLLLSVYWWSTYRHQSTCGPRIAISLLVAHVLSSVY